MNRHDGKKEIQNNDVPHLGMFGTHLTTIISSDRETRIRNPAIPGCCSQRCDPSLEDPHEELEGILSNYHKIYGWKEDAAMDEESHDHGNHIHPKLLCNHFQVSDGDDLSTDKAGDTKR